MNALICLARRHGWYGFLAIVLALLMVACGGGRHNQQAALPLEQAPTGIGTPVSQTPATLAEALAQLDALAMPEGATPAVWVDLKAKLREGLNDRFGGKGAAKIASSAPTGVENVVKWIYSDRDVEAGPAHLTWRYNNRGDYNLDGIVNVSDIVQLAMAFGVSTGDNPQYESVDGNANGVVDIGDLTTIVTHFGNECSGYAVSMITGSPATWTQLTTIPLSHAPVTEGNRTYVLSCADWVQQSPDRYVVRPYDSLGNWGEYSIPAYALDNVPYREYDVVCLAGFPFDFRPDNIASPLVMRWEFPSGMSPRFSVGGGITLTAFQPGEYQFFGIREEDYGSNSYTYRILFNLHVLEPDRTPIVCKRLSTPSGPLIYWPIKGYGDLVTSEVYRDGAYLAKTDPGIWFYLDDTCGMATHSYSVVLKSGGFPMTSSTPITAGGAAFTNEHLYLLAEPQEIAAVRNVSTLAVLVNNRHELQSIPSLRIWQRGQQVSGVYSLNDKLFTYSETPLKSASAADSLLPVTPAFEFAIPYGYGVEVCTMPYVFSPEGGITRVPPNGVILFGPFDVRVSPPLSDRTMLIPSTNEEGDYCFYLDSDENMYSFEYVHGISMTTFMPSSGIPSRLIDKKLPEGIQPLPGDFNKDGVVNISDITGFTMTYMSTNTDVIQYNDQNGDGAVTIFDLYYMLSNYGAYL
jgi:hypothetical protein